MIFGNSKFKITQVFYFWCLYSNDLCMLKAAKITQRFSILHLKILTLSFLIWRSGGRTKHCKRKKHNAQVFPATLLRDPHDFCFFVGGGSNFYGSATCSKKGIQKRKCMGKAGETHLSSILGFPGPAMRARRPCFAGAVRRLSCSRSDPPRWRRWS